MTDANLHYEGSITLDRALMEAAGIHVFEKVEVYNVTNGERFATYAIEGGPGTVCINGAAAWKARADDKIIIASYVMLDPSEVKAHRPALVFVGPKNEIVKITQNF